MGREGERKWGGRERERVGREGERKWGGREQEWYIHTSCGPLGWLGGRSTKVSHSKEGRPAQE